MASLNTQLNLYSYVTPSLEEPFKKSSQVIETLEILLPLFNLYQPFGRWVAIGGSSLQLGDHAFRLLNNPSKEKTAIHLLQLSLAASSFMSALLQSRLSTLYISSYECAGSVYHLGACIYQGESISKTGGAFFQTLRHTIQVASVVNPCPQLIVISLIAQVAFESYHLYQECHSAEPLSFLKIFTKTVVLTTHIYQLKQWMLPPLALMEEDPIETQKFENFINELLDSVQKESIDLNAFLQAKGQSTCINRVNFAKILHHPEASNRKREFFKNLNLQGLSFVHCYFDELNLENTSFSGLLQGCSFQKTLCQNVRFENCKIIECNFQFADLNHAIFINTTLQTSDFKFANLTQAFFKQVQFIEVIFKQSCLYKAIFLTSNLNHCYIENANLKESCWISTDCEDVLANGASFVQARIKNCYWRSSDFSNCIFKKAYIDHLITHKNSFNDASFNYSKIYSCVFQNTSFNYASFHDSSLVNFQAHQAVFLGTSFLDAKVSKSSIYHSDLLDCLFFDTLPIFKMVDCTDPIITRPIIGLPWNVESPGFTVPKVYRSLKTFEGIPLKLDYLPDHIDVVKLDNEIKAALKTAPHHHPSAPILKHILQAPGTEIAKIRQRAETYSKYLSAAVFPGGNNVESEFYEGTRVEAIYYDPDYRRTLFESALLYDSVKADIPIVCICRGIQLLNVTQGGTVKNVEDQWKKTQEYMIQDGKIQKMMGEKITAISTHRQALDQVAPNLKVVVQYDGIVKAVEGINCEIYGFQFHPEWVLDDQTISPENGNIFTYQIETAKNYKKNQPTAAA